MLGGLGGFGMELTAWAIERGAKNIILCSRSGIQTGYQKYRVNIWKSQNIKVEISTFDLTTLSGAKNIVKLALSLGPLGGIFNLAGVRFLSNFISIFKTSLCIDFYFTI